MGSFDPNDAAVPQTSAPPALTDLPSNKSPDLELVVATELERTQSWHINLNAWRGPLTPAQYLQREVQLEQQPLVNNNKITFWILTYRNGQHTNTDGSRPILAACETLLKQAYVAQNGELQRVLAHGVASVFCRPEYRGKGYASRMMDELGLKLGRDAWQQAQGTSHGYFSVLYSDIGQKFYAKHGWAVMQSTHIMLSGLDQAAYEETRSRLNLPKLTELKTKDTAQFCATATSQVEQELITKSKASSSSCVAIKPDREHMSWNFAREELQCHFLDNPYPAVKGAMDPATGCALIWCRVYDSDPAEAALNILKTVGPTVPSVTPEEIRKSQAALLLRAQLEAKAWDMQMGVEVWSPEQSTLEAAELLSENEKKVVVVVRDKEHICSLRWEGGDQDEIEWIANERYAWC